jgi:flagellin
LVIMASYASNTDSILAQTQVKKTTTKLSEQFRKLSTGLRINSPKDDPAGLAIADALRADAKVASVAIRNANDGLSLTAIADSALDEISSILSRMKELAEQSANGTYTMTQRSALQLEFVALGSEVQRIATTTEFNDFSLLNDSQDIIIQVGLDSTANSQITIAGVQATVQALGIGDGTGALSIAVIDVSSTASQTTAATALSTLSTAIDALSSTRGTLSAAESRLSYAISHVTSTRDNYTAAESKIRDADIAQEVAELVRLQVLQQASTAILAQANQTPATTLALLQ